MIHDMGTDMPNKMQSNRNVLKVTEKIKYRASCEGCRSTSGSHGKLITRVVAIATVATVAIAAPQQQQQQQE